MVGGIGGSFSGFPAGRSRGDPLSGRPEPRCGVRTANRRATADKVEPELLAQTLEVDLIGALRVAQAFIPLMKSHDYGRIVNLSSSLGCLTEMGGPHAERPVEQTVDTILWLATLPND